MKLKVVVFLKRNFWKFFRFKDNWIKNLKNSIFIEESILKIADAQSLKTYKSKHFMMNIAQNISCIILVNIICIYQNFSLSENMKWFRTTKIASFAVLIL